MEPILLFAAALGCLAALVVILVDVIIALRDLYKG